MEPLRPAGSAVSSSPRGMAGQREPANLADILERVLDRGVVIAGDIRVNLLDIELLTIKLRLIVASVDTAKEMGIDWWEHDPWLTGRNEHLEAENRWLRRRLAELEDDPPRSRSVRAAVEPEAVEPEAVEPEAAEPEVEAEVEPGTARAYDDEAEPVRRAPDTGRRHDR